MIRKLFSILFYFSAVIFVIVGFYKMHRYDNSEYSIEKINVYVGGDAYNYIINANYATAYFVLALIFVILGSVMLIIEYVHQTKSAMTNLSEYLKTVTDAKAVRELI